MALESILIRKGSLIDVGERRIARVGSKKERYLIYLPIERNYIWKNSGRAEGYVFTLKSLTSPRTSSKTGVLALVLARAGEH